MALPSFSSASSISKAEGTGDGAGMDIGKGDGAGVEGDGANANDGAGAGDPVGREASPLHDLPERKRLLRPNSKLCAVKAEAQGVIVVAPSTNIANADLQGNLVSATQRLHILATTFPTLCC